MILLNNYQNGNVKVSLFDDGTKIREFEDSPNILHPESIDVKITNYCEPTKDNAICGYCHEKSSLKGKHADLNKLKKILSCLTAGVEIAVGGGNPLSHPDLVNFLTDLQKQGIICNITINQKHLQPYFELIKYLINNNLVKGVGISYSDQKYFSDIIPILQLTNNVVFHVIMGVNHINDIAKIYELCQSNNRIAKVLILGYKKFGFGLNYYFKHKEIDNNKYNWYTNLPLWFKKDNLVLSFDNLAIGQLNLKRFFTPQAWERFYMGDDFVYTMYIDAVEQNYAPSSTSNDRISFEKLDLISYFQKYKSNKIKSL